MKSVTDIVNQWPKPRVFAEEVGVEFMTAHQWKLRNSIPPRYWPVLVEKARARRIKLSIDDLAAMAAAQKRAGKTSKRKAKRKSPEEHGVAA